MVLPQHQRMPWPFTRSLSNLIWEKAWFSLIKHHHHTLELAIITSIACLKLNFPSLMVIILSGGKQLLKNTSPLRVFFCQS
jgi:hypothetical protein